MRLIVSSWWTSRGSIKSPVILARPVRTISSASWPASFLLLRLSSSENRSMLRPLLPPASITIHWIRKIHFPQSKPRLPQLSRNMRANPPNNKPSRVFNRLSTDWTRYRLRQRSLDEGNILCPRSVTLNWVVNANSGSNFICSTCLTSEYTFSVMVVKTLQARWRRPSMIGRGKT